MNDAHTHLVVNHFPIIGLIIGALILIAGLLFKSSAVRNTAYFIILLASAFSIPSFSSGEGAEEVVEHMGNMTEKTHHLIHEHEEKAEGFMPIAWNLMILSLLGFVIEWKVKKFAIYLSILILLIAGFGIFKVREVGTSGGEIMHEEIRKDFKSGGEHHEENEHNEKDED